ncbi:hypothetical protein T265_02449 [Opisthorchis viverrini]|uniref:Uncharacterized protein n=1 Tax=Opisthorchis viverrini TaxID=6198 RepID=A0A074ZZ45_OPIVI|nr:hypothetical protein T265_02449 [Opisthorchis viverrini]KER31257.1 hypothetical protein T265_02449 [Opisthorchis viverrini]
MNQQQQQTTADYPRTRSQRGTAFTPEDKDRLYWTYDNKLEDMIEEEQLVRKKKTNSHGQFGHDEFTMSTHRKDTVPNPK